MMRYLLMIVAILSLTSCGIWVAPRELKPNAHVFNDMPKGGSAEYEQGWQEGCESGFSSETNSFYQSFYAFKQDNKLMSNEVYYKAWKDSYDYCKGVGYGAAKESNTRRALPNDWGVDPMRQRSGFIDWLDNLGGPRSLVLW